MGVLDNGRTWTCTINIYDLNFGNPLNNDSITAYNTATYTNTNIKNWKITDTMSANGDVAFGSTGSKALNLELIGLSSKLFGTGAIIEITLGGAASKTWVFFADTVAWNTEYGTTTKYAASVQAYDAMYYASSKISGLASNNTTPPAIQSILASGTADMAECKTLAQYCIRHARYNLIRARASELADVEADPAKKAQLETYASMYDSKNDDGWTSGNTMDDVCADSTGKIQIGDTTGFTGNVSISNAITGRSLLGRMAALNGLRAYCDNYALSKVGTINFTSLMGAYYNTITKADVYDNGFVSEGTKKFQFFTNGKVTHGKKTSSGFSTMSIDCPDMTQAKIDALGGGFEGTTYEIGTVKFRGDPNLTSGMRLYAPDATGTTHDIVCTKVVTNYDGGLYQQIYSEGKSDSDIEFENNRDAENAEQIVDEGGGGGGGTSLLYYTETTSPDTATITVGGNSVQVNTTETDITGDLSVTGDITCSGTMTYNILSANGLIVSGGASIGGNISVGDSSKILLQKTTAQGLYTGSITATKLEGHDIDLETPRIRNENGSVYESYNSVKLYTYDPSMLYDGGGIYSAETEYGVPPMLRIRRAKIKDSEDKGVDGAVYGVNNIHFATAEKTYTSGGLDFTMPIGGIKIELSKLSDTEPSLTVTFYNRNTGAVLGNYQIKKANIAALANLT